MQEVIENFVQLILAENKQVLHMLDEVAENAGCVMNQRYCSRRSLVVHFQQCDDKFAEIHSASSQMKFFAQFIFHQLSHEG